MANRQAIKIIENFLGNPVDSNMEALIEHVKTNDLDDSEVVHLAKGLANSGQLITPIAEDIYDIASTGGPSSLSTLLCPLFLRLLGNKVLKLGVPGRPAGGIDVLAQIAGYNIAPDIMQLRRWLASSGYVHFIAGEIYTPLDAILFNYRKNNSAVNIPSLAMASLLSKKIVVGITNLGLDIRVSHFGNFGVTWDTARQNGIRFNRIANIVGIRSKCFLTNGNVPQQPYIGRGEAILALKRVFKDEIDQYLKKHLACCFAMSYSISNNKQPNIFLSDSIRRIFNENVKTQEGSINSFDLIALDIEQQHRHEIRAWENGILLIDMEKIRLAILRIHAKSKEMFPDTCGLILKVTSNEYIKKGDVICTFRCDYQEKQEFEDEIKSAFNTTAQIVPFSDFEEII